MGPETTDNATSAVSPAFIDKGAGFAWPELVLA
jgi:hypothetical protein